MNWTSPYLPDLLAQVWTRLEAGCQDKTNPWHLPVLGTLNRNRPALRIMSLRAVESKARVLACYSDHRASKIQQILGAPQVEWLFYDQAAGLHLRASGTAAVHHLNPVTRAAWEQKPVISHLQYLSPLAPGTGLPAAVPVSQPDLQESELAYRNFAVIVTVVSSFDLLIVGETRDQRASFTWDGERFVPQWMVP